MKVLPGIYLLLLTLLILSHCKKDVPVPNENWVAGVRWIDTRDGHSYTTIPIGNQIWIAENMAYLPGVNKVEDGSEDQGKEKDPFYYVYDYNGTDVTAAKETSNYTKYGVLYNYNAALKACPEGWHLPTDLEWMDLESYLGMSSIDLTGQGYRGTDEGNLVKATWGWEFDTWKDKYGNGTNETGFTALPGGDRYLDYTDYTLSSYIIGDAGICGYWWSASKETDEQGNTLVWYRVLIYTFDKICRSRETREQAMSVRCIKN
jgi:uncharacterized protein (TIGR02145 family)